MRRLLKARPLFSTGIIGRLTERLDQAPALRTVAVFAALPGEPDLQQLHARLPDRRWVYPRVCGTDHLTFHVVEHPATQLVQGAFGIPEPSPATKEIPVCEIDAFLCPGLAFDAMGGRLGRGRGFYDRILSQARPDALRIGVCHAIQIVPDTFSEPHDIRMHEVISA